MIILAVDTALAACSVAVVSDGRTLARVEPMARGQAEALMGMIGAVLAEAAVGYGDIDRFAVTVGPGTFTGVRVGVSTVRGLALVTGRPAVGVTTLEALAETARTQATRSGTAPQPLLVAMDARRGEIYAQCFDAEGEPASAPQVASPEAVLDGLPADVSAVCGSAAEAVAHRAAAYGRTLRVAGTAAFPDPVVVARIAAKRDADAPPAPLYLRPPDAKPQAGAALARR